MAKNKAKARSSRRSARPYRVLCLDGGGIRGLITAVWLEALEKRLGGRLNQHVDLVAGTSTGSILACAIGLGIPAAEIRRMYVEYADEIFPGRAARLWSRAVRLFSEGPSAPKYDGRGLERALRSQFGDARFRDLSIRPTLVTAYNTLTRSAEVFKNTRERFADLRVWELVKASCSAPTYFPATVLEVEGTRSPFVDGGMVANNPTACAIAEAVAENQGRKAMLGRIVVASFGTGHSTRPISIGEAQEWGALEWAVPVIDVLMDGAGDAVDYVARQLLPEGRYFRFQTQLDSARDDMDDPSSTNLEALAGVAARHLRRVPVREQLNALCKLL